MNHEARHAGAAAPLVTLVVTPRERWGLAVRSLESIRDQTSDAFQLIYVDGGMPRRVRKQIEAICAAAGYTFLPSARFLAPNEARNRGAQAARTPYVVFIDNDVMVSPGWLAKLVEEAEASGADVVAPLTCQGMPFHKQIHQAGGTFAEAAGDFFAAPKGARRINEQNFLQTATVDDPSVPGQPFDAQLCEFHCALVRRETLERLGWLDEQMLATKEHLDFCMSLTEAGGRVRIEPRSVVTYVFPSRANPMTFEDYPYFTLRWSPRWQIASLDHFQEKWGLVKDPYFEERRTKLQWRHVEGIVRPSLNRVSFLRGQPLWHKVGGRALRGGLRVVSELMAYRHAGQRTRAGR